MGIYGSSEIAWKRRHKKETNLLLHLFFPCSQVLKVFSNDEVLAFNMAAFKLIYALLTASVGLAMAQNHSRCTEIRARVPW